MEILDSVTVGSSGGGVPSMLGFFGSSFDGANDSVRRGAAEWSAWDERCELDTFEHGVLTGRIRWLTENVGFAKSIINGIATLRGHVTPYAATEDDDWNDLVDAYVLEKGGNALTFDNAGKFDLFTIQETLSLHQLVEGDHATIFTGDDAGNPLFQFVTSQNLVNPSGSAPAGLEWINGVLVNNAGKHMGYNFRGRKSGDDHKVPARDVALFCQYGRTAGVRALPPLAHAVNHAVDITEIWADLKHGIKAANLFGFAISGGRGASKGAQAGVTAKLLNKKVTVGGQEIEVEEVDGGGRALHLNEGAQVTTLSDARPHSNQTDFINMLIGDICAGTKYPPEVLYSLGSHTSPEMRFIMARAKKRVHADRMMLDRWVCRVRAYMIAKGIENGDLPRPRANFAWWKCVTMGQADPTIDRAKDKQDWEAVLAGGMSMQVFCAERGIYWKDHLGQLVKLRQYFATQFPDEDINHFFKFADGALATAEDFRQG